MRNVSWKKLWWLSFTLGALPVNAWGYSEMMRLRAEAKVAQPRAEEQARALATQKETEVLLLPPPAGEKAEPKVVPFKPSRLDMRNQF